MFVLHETDGGYVGQDEVKVLPRNDGRIIRIAEGCDFWICVDCRSRGDK